MRCERPRIKAIDALGARTGQELPPAFAMPVIPAGRAAINQGLTI
jgi:hypothetical protein